MRRILPVLLLAPLALTACAEDSTSTTPEAASTSASPSAAPTRSPSPRPTPSPTPTSAALSLGEAAQVTEAGVPSGTILIEAPQVSADPYSEYADPPENDYFVTFPVTATAVGSSTFDVNPFDFYYRTADGSRFGYGDGASYYPDDMLNSGTLNPGEKIAGTITFDVPAGPGELVYAPGFDSRALGYWSVTAE